MTFRHTSCRRILQTSLLRNPLSSPMANIVIICVLPLDPTIRRRKVTEPALLRDRVLVHEHAHWELRRRPK